MALWQYGRAYTNLHILELDKANPHAVYDANGVFQDTIYYDRLYNANIQTQFDQKLREELGIPVNSKEWIDFDSYDPSVYSVDFFSAEEMLNNGNNFVSYYGYDHHGNKLTNKPTLNDFLTAKDDAGRYKREIASFQPIYGAAYIQDKFAFNDLIFNVGVRIDRFDANQMVLKDPFSLYETKKLSEVSGSLNPSGVHPGNIGQDAVVYADNVKSPTTITGYREGIDPNDVKWYNAAGTQVNDPTVLAFGGRMNPILTNPDGGLTVDAFKDYEPQINVMPRIAFSFPVSDVALFFAHYDILTKRPDGSVRMDPIQYLYIQNQTGNSLNNPNLQTEKTITYELGFQQKLNNTSSLKLSAFYNEMRDQIQTQYIYGAYPLSYITYTNIDFGTVKGLTISYDLRRTGNVTFRASYTLQFANGTGSNSETSKALIQTGQPNLRATIPLDYDQRHALTGNIDYRFASGRAYSGPKIGGKDILQNTGANFTLNYGTGSPYSKRDMNTNYLIGSINGARKPSRFTVNMRLDRDIELNYGKGEGDNKKTANLNVYLEINNLLNNKGILNVYSTTGNPDDDGYLTNAKNQLTINSQNSPEAYRNYYTMQVNYPYNYTLARTIHLGVALSF
jgi:outer membrane receptor protein involved in Fe transport